MPGLADSLVQQMQIWSAFAHLRSADEAERLKAMETLRAGGSASMPYLHFALNGIRDHRRRFAAAVVPTLSATSIAACTRWILFSWP